MDHSFDGDWPTLFDAPSRTLRSVFLGDPTHPGAGIVELVVFAGGVTAPTAPIAPMAAPSIGFFLLSFFLDVPTTLARLAALGLGGEPRRIEQPGPEGPVPMATVRDPDGVLVELIQGRPPAA